MTVNTRLTSIIQDLPAANKSNLNDVAKNLGVTKKTAQEIIRLQQQGQSVILSDNPVSRDQLGMDSLIRTISNIVVSSRTQTPLTIGLNGRWGTGKTSILKQVQSHAEFAGIPCIWLNAWALESPRNVMASFREQISNDLREQGVKRTSRGLRMLGRRGKLEEISDSAERDEQALQEVSTDDDIATTVLIQRQWRALVDEILSQDETEKPDPKKTPSPNRILVFIDDLDRAMPGQMTSVLRTLKLILDIENCIYVLAMDMDIVAEGINRFYRAGQMQLPDSTQTDVSSWDTVQALDSLDEVYQHFGYHFLEKLIQIHLQVPRLTRPSVVQFLEKNMIAPEIIQLLRWAPDEEYLNPRRLKQYINWLSVSLDMVNSEPGAIAFDPLLVLQVLALRRDHPEVYQTLVATGSDDDELSGQVSAYLSSKQPYDNGPGSPVSEFSEYIERFDEESVSEIYELLQSHPSLDLGKTAARTVNNAEPRPLIKGNISRRDGSTRKIFHAPGGDFYHTVRVNESKGDRWFWNEEEAKSAGFKQSGTSRAK